MKRVFILLIILFCHKGVWAQVEIQGKAIEKTSLKSNTERSFTQSSGEIDVYLPIPVSSDEDLITILFNTLQTNVEYSSEFKSNTNESYPEKLNSITYGMGTLLDFDEKLLLIEGDMTRASDDWQPTGTVGSSLRIAGIVEWFRGLRLGVGASYSIRRDKGQILPLLYINYESDWLEITGLIPLEIEIIGNISSAWQVQFTGGFDGTTYEINRNRKKRDLFISLFSAELSLGYRIMPELIASAGFGHVGDQKWKYVDVNSKRTIERLNFDESSSAFIKLEYNFK